MIKLLWTPKKLPIGIEKRGICSNGGRCIMGWRLNGFELSREYDASHSLFGGGDPVAKEAGIPNLHTIALSTLGFAYLRLGQFDKAIAVLQECLEVSRANSFTFNIVSGGGTLVLCYLRTGQREQALDLLQELYPSYRKNPALWGGQIPLLWGRAEYYLGSAEQAKGSERARWLKLARPACDEAIKTGQRCRPGMPGSMRLRGMHEWLAGKHGCGPKVVAAQPDAGRRDGTALRFGAGPSGNGSAIGRARPSRACRGYLHRNWRGVGLGARAQGITKATSCLIDARQSVVAKNVSATGVCRPPSRCSRRRLRRWVRRGWCVQSGAAADARGVGRYKEKVMVKVHAIQTGKVKIKKFEAIRSKKSNITDVAIATYK